MNNDDGTSVKPGVGSFGGGRYVADWKVMQGQEGKALESPHHYIHALFVFGLSWLVSWDVCFWWGALMIGVAHLGIDIWKSYREDSVLWFTLDQVLHLLVVAGVAYAWTECFDWNLPFGIELWHVAVVVALLVCWKPANIFIKLMLKHYSVNMPTEGNGRGRSNAYIAGSGVDVGADIFRRGLCLPSDNKMNAEQQDLVIDIIKKCFE